MSPCCPLPLCTRCVRRHILVPASTLGMALGRVCCIALVLAATSVAAQTPAPSTNSPTELDAVKVQARQLAGAVPTLSRSSTTASRLGLTRLDTPASIDIIEAGAIRLRGDRNIAEAASRAAGIIQSGSSAGGALASRGFVGNTSVMRLYDGTRQYVSGGTVTFPFDSWQAERIEVLRGPASILYGEGAIGGAINTVPKKPRPEPISSELRLIGGSHATRRAALGSGGALGERVSYRVDISHNRTDGHVVRGQQHSLLGAAAVRLDVSPELHFTLAHDDGKQESPGYYGIPLIDGRVERSLRKANFNVEDARADFHDRWSRLGLEWTPVDSFSLRNSLYRISADRYWQDSERYFHQPGTRRISRQYLGIDYHLEQLGNRLDVKWQRPLGRFGHTLAMGFDGNRLKYARTRNDSAPAQVFEISQFVPDRYPTTGLRVGELFTTRTDTWSVFAEDQLQISERISVVTGLRWDAISYEKRDSKGVAANVYKDFRQSSWRVGVVHALNDAASLYAQYSTAADPLTGVVNTTAQQSQLDMSTGRQAELGWKQRFADGRGELTLAAYWIEKKKLLIRDAVDPDVFQQVGAQSSRGIEATLSYTPVDSLWFEFNATALDAKFDQFNEVVSGQVLSRQGNTPREVPERIANAWLTWAFLPQWDASLGARHVGTRYLNNANSLRAPSYTVMDANVRWRLRPGTVLALHGYNLGDRLYAQTLYSDQWVLAPPRTAELSLYLAF